MDNLDNLIPMVNSPVDLGKRNIKNILEGYHRDIQGLTIMDSFDIPFRAEDYQIPYRKKFFFAAENKTYMVTIAKGKIKVSVVADFVVKEVRECTHVFNNKSNEQASYQRRTITLFMKHNLHDFEEYFNYLYSGDCSLNKRLNYKQLLHYDDLEDFSHK